MRISEKAEIKLKLYSTHPSDTLGRMSVYGVLGMFIIK